ncbi:MAG TPA: hypothetical protein VFG65_08780 [Fimbriimonadales bacterium]|nr:hypothetical protein [Fimbriimonadales bacterium]
MKRDAVVLLALAIAGVAFALIARNAISDGAFVALRMVRHALEGQGLRYNAGDMGVQPVTSPLTLLLLLLVASVASIFGVSPEASALAAPVVLFCFAMPVVAILAYLLMLGDKQRSFLAAAVACFMVAAPLALKTIGLDAMMTAGLSFGALLAYRERKLGLMGVLLGLAVLSRHDVAILAAILILSSMRTRKGSDLGRGVLYFGAILIPWLAFSSLYFGVSAPTTLNSKLALGGTLYYFHDYAVGAGHWVAEFFFGIGGAILAGAVAFCGLAWAGFERSRAAGAIAAYVAFQAIDFVIYWRLWIPDEFWYAVPYALAMLLCCGWLLSQVSGEKVGENLSTAVSVACIAAVGFACWQVAPKVDPGAAAFRDVGRYLEAKPPTHSVGIAGMAEIGFYATRCRIFDFSGITTLSQIPRIRDNGAHTWIDHPKDIDTAVTRGEQKMLDPDFAEAFKDKYVLDKAFPPDPEHPKGLQVWRLRP